MSEPTQAGVYRWAITDHLCAKCLGRVLTDGKVSRCSNCGEEANGSPSEICACGVRVAARCSSCGRQYTRKQIGDKCISVGCSGTITKGPKAGLYCIANDNPTPDFPGEIVVIASES